MSCAIGVQVSIATPIVLGAILTIDTLTLIASGMNFPFDT